MRLPHWMKLAYSADCRCYAPVGVLISIKAISENQRDGFCAFLNGRCPLVEGNPMLRQRLWLCNGEAGQPFCGRRGQQPLQVAAAME